MERDRGPGDDRVVKLLAVLVALVAVLVLGAAAGGVALWREYRSLRAAVQAVAGGEGASLRGVAVEISGRQQRAADELTQVTRDAKREIARFERRADELRGQGGGAIAAASRAVETTQLMTDEMILQLKLMAELHAVIEKTVRPLAPERALLEGGGDAGATPPGAAPAPRARRGPPRAR
jgi:hypothetical protein